MMTNMRYCAHIETNSQKYLSERKGFQTTAVENLKYRCFVQYMVSIRLTVLGN
jgi:hypothetical protein